MEALGSLLRCSGSPFSSLWSPGDPHEGYFGTIRLAFERQNMENVDFVILMPLCSETTTFEGLGCQVGASRAPKMVSGTVRTAEPGDFGRSGGTWSVRVMGTVGNNRKRPQITGNQPRLKSSRRSKSI